MVEKERNLRMALGGLQEERKVGVHADNLGDGPEPTQLDEHLVASGLHEPVGGDVA